MPAIANKSTATPGYIRHIRPGRGSILRFLLNLLLRIVVKWRQGLRVDIARMRNQMQTFNDRAARQRIGVERVEVNCQGVPAQWLLPTTTDTHGGKPVLLYLHGGAFVTRSPELHGRMLANWCRHLGMSALMVDYRLAPEHRYPAAIDDCQQAWEWLLAQGYSAGDIVLAGDSAGGNLALALLHRINAAGGAMPACGVLLSPFVDFTLSGQSSVDNCRHDAMFTLPFALDIRTQYARPEQFLQADVSPLFGDFCGLPPLLLQVGSSEMLLDDSLRCAARAHAAGVEVQLEIWQRLPHVFQIFGELPQAREAQQSIIRFIRTHCQTQAVSQTRYPATATP